MPSQDALDQLAGRIERAYRLRHSQWKPAGTTPGVWISAAARLHQASQDRGGMPIDPELFVAAQPQGKLRPDPWVDLTQMQSSRRYLSLVRRIVGKLFVELRQEIRRADRQILRGITLEALLNSDEPRISPLSRFILAHRAGRLDLAARCRTAAHAQHRACPLYRLASRDLLPPQAYPTLEVPTFQFSSAEYTAAFSLN